MFRRDFLSVIGLGGVGSQFKFDQSNSEIQKDVRLDYTPSDKFYRLQSLLPFGSYRSDELMEIELPYVSKAKHHFLSADYQGLSLTTSEADYLTFGNDSTLCGWTGDSSTPHQERYDKLISKLDDILYKLTTKTLNRAVSLKKKRKYPTYMDQVEKTSPVKSSLSYQETKYGTVQYRSSIGFILIDQSYQFYGFYKDEPANEEWGYIRGRMFVFIDLNMFNVI